MSDARRNQTNYDAALPVEIKAQAALAVKDHYTFDFLDLSQEHSERELERSLVNNIRRFLTEMGGAFTFVSIVNKLLLLMTWQNLPSTTLPIPSRATIYA